MYRAATFLVTRTKKLKKSPLKFVVSPISQTERQKRAAMDREVCMLLLKESSAKYRAIDTSSLPSVVDPDDDGTDV